MTDFTTLLGGGAVITVLVGCWSYIKSYIHKIYSFLFLEISPADSPGCEFIKAVNVWARYKCKSTRFAERHFIALDNFIKPIEKNQLIAYEVIPNNHCLLWYKRKPIIISNGGNKITFIRGLLTYEELLIDITDTYNSTLGDAINKKQNRFYVRKFHGTLLDNKNNIQTGPAGNSVKSDPADTHSTSFYKEIENTLTPIKWKRDEIGMIKKENPLDHLSLSKEVLKIVDGLKLWRKSEEWYKSRQIPWKNGCLFYGKPGTGKTSIARALAMELNMPIMIFDLSSMSNNDFNNNWSQVKNNAPCMVLFEDLDSVFNGRQNITGNEGGITFDVILNNIDGIESSDGLLTIITTNNIDVIDPALGRPTEEGISSRPGRINSVVELKSPDKDGFIKIANRILVDFQEEKDRVVIEAIANNDSGAQFQERCSKLALELFWKAK